MADIPVVFTWVFIFILKVTESDGQDLSVNSSDLRETTDATLICDNIHAPDGAKVTFNHTWEGQPIRTWVESSKNNRSTHAMKSLSIQDAGEYDCTVGSETSNNVTLALKAAPRLMSAPYAITYTDVDRTVNLTGKFLHISPTVQTYRWSRNGSHLSEKKTDMTVTRKGFRMYGKQIYVYETTVWITWSMTSSDFGLYDVIACTNGGCSSAVVEVKLLIPPLPPVEFSVADNLTDGFWFRWRSDDSAVREQTFELSYKRADTTDGWYSKETEEKTGPGVLVHSRISDLAVDTRYDVRVRAVYAQDKNKESSYTEELSVFIRAPVHELGVGAGVGIGMSSMVLVAALICLAISLVQRNKRKRHCSSQMDTSCCSDDGYSSKTQMSNMSTMSTNPYQSSPPKEVMPELAVFPTPASKESRPALPCSPIPRDKRTASKGVPQTAAPTPPAPRRTCQKKSSAPRQPPVPLPLPPTDDNVYEPMQGEDEGGENEQEYVDPQMAYQNM